MPILTDELNHLTFGSLEMAKKIGAVKKKTTWTHADVEFLHAANSFIGKASWALKNVSHET